MSEKIIAKVLDRAQAAIDPAEGIAAVSDPGFGGIDVFIGKVRDVNVGRRVTGITYDLFEPLVLNEFKRLAAEVEATFGPKLKLYVAHAKGRLGIGDVAVVVAAGSPHRDEAFRACRQLIEGSSTSARSGSRSITKTATASGAKVAACAMRTAKLRTPTTTHDHGH